MKISLSWLKRYVDIPVSVDELCEKMVMSGFEVESVDYLGASLQNVVAGRIEKLEKHPNADKLQICRMNVGTGEAVPIITGAQNVFEGATVPVALHDSRLPNGKHIKRGKLRGLPSEGMLCSGEELGLKEDDYPGAGVNGILILSGDIAPGTDMREVLHLNDTVIDFKITANRPDCQSVLGVAREIAVALQTPFHAPLPGYRTAGGDIRDVIRVDVEDSDLCPRYLGRAVNNLRIAPSPVWMQDCLRSAGMRPINNIVDITNFVMLETGQPMHAFDRRDIRGNRIIVRRAHEGETMTTLDGREHTLSGEMLVIADEEAPSCLAGIMGGLNSEIKEDTTELFLESAKFRRDSVRRTARSLGMRTESSARFEHGVDILNVEYAMNRALQLINELDAGDIVDGAIDRYVSLPKPRLLRVDADSINALLGVRVPHRTMADILNRLDIETTLEDGILNCLVPSFRDDIEGRADLAEEIMRVYGYGHIVGTRMSGQVRRGRKSEERKKTDSVKSLLVSAGLREITTFSFISPKAADTLRLPEGDARRAAIPIRNPLGDEYSVMRTQLVTSMLTVLATNDSRKAPAARLFEIGKRFIPKELPLAGQPKELLTLCIGMYGENESFFTLKGIIESLMSLFGVEAEYERAHEPYGHPGRSARAVAGEKTLALFGELHPDMAEDVGIGHKVYIAEVYLDALFTGSKPAAVYRPLPKYPAVERDLAVLCESALPVAAIESAIRGAGGRFLEEVRLFDVYQGPQIREGYKNVAYSLWFRSEEGTLTDADIEVPMRKIIRHLEQIGCTLRG